jgi:hypothetical protein
LIRKYFGFSADASRARVLAAHADDPRAGQQERTESEAFAAAARIGTGKIDIAQNEEGS